MPFGTSNEELEQIRKIATETLKTYGDFDEVGWDQIKTYGIWNDHCSVQTGIAVLKHFKSLQK